MMIVQNLVTSRCRECGSSIREESVSESEAAPRSPMLRCHECAADKWERILTRRRQRMIVTAPIRLRTRLLH